MTSTPDDGRGAKAPLTLMAVHAHPDDEASTTGGVLAKYSGEGLRTVLVTCTNGECGDGPNGAKPGEPGHDEAALVELRRSELEESCRILGVTDLELLGFRDSGMEGWSANDAVGAFSTLPVEAASEPLVALMDRYRPDVVITYDEYGFYGHPDHIQAHRITVAALDRVGRPTRLYCPTVRRSRLGAFAGRMSQGGVELPDVDESQFGSADEDIAATIDCRAQAPAKLAALGAHASQSENIFFLRLGLDDFTDMFGTEEFIRLRGRAVGPTPTADLFDGLRARDGVPTPSS
jgi:LmbE family N-acetylglucosaminyl deacetylase